MVPKLPIQLLQQIQHKAIESAHYPIVISDMQHPEQPLIYFNEYFLKLTGYTYEEVVGRNCNFLQQEDTNQDEIKVIKKAFKEQKPCVVILRNYKKNGELFYNQLRLSPVFDDHNQLTHYIGIQHDVTSLVEKEKFYKNQIEKGISNFSSTAQKLTEINLELKQQIAEAKKAKKLASSTLNVLDTVAKNFPNGVIVIINENSVVDYLEGEEKEIITKNIFDIYQNAKEIETNSNSNVNLLKERMQDTLNGSHLNFEVDFDNTTFSVNTTPLPVSTDNKKKALLVFINITKQKKTAKKLEESLDKEKELSKLKSKFISLASHEFKTPLSVINLAATIIDKLNNDSKPEEITKYIHRIKENVNSLNTILDDFLSLSKIEESKNEINLTTFNIVPFLNSCIDELQHYTNENKTIVLENNLNEANVILDKKMLHYVLQNLLTNALKYSATNSVTKLIVEKENQQLIIRVKDQGTGIPLKDQKFIFSRFYRATNVEDIKGTGLGLSIAKQYTELMKGLISFESVENLGSTFTLTFKNAFIIS